MPDEASVRRFMEKMLAYLDWLDATFAVRFLTLEELRRAAEHGDFRPGSAPAGAGDWTRPPKTVERKGMDSRMPSTDTSARFWRHPSPEARS